MKFIRLDYVDPGLILKGLKEGPDGKKTCLGRTIDRFTMTVDDAIAFVVLFSAEFIATFILLGIGCAALSRWDIHLKDFPRSMAFGIVTLILIEIFGWISGAHMNPTISLAAFVSGKLSIQKFLTYFIAQMLGGLCGYGCLVILRLREYLSNNKCTSTCITFPNIVHDEQAFGIEFVASILLGWFCCSVWDKQNQDIHESISLRFSFAMLALIFVTGFYTGGSLNPIRSFIPALFNECWDKHWIYWAGPLAGALIGALVHDLLWRPDLWFGRAVEDEPTRKNRCALREFSENLVKVFNSWMGLHNKVDGEEKVSRREEKVSRRKHKLFKREDTLFLRSKKIFYDPNIGFDTIGNQINEIESLDKLMQKEQQKKQHRPQEPSPHIQRDKSTSTLEGDLGAEKDLLGEKLRLEALTSQPQSPSSPPPPPPPPYPSQQPPSPPQSPPNPFQKPPSSPSQPSPSPQTSKPPLQRENTRSLSDTFRRFDDGTSYPSGNWMVAGSPHMYMYKKGKKFRSIGTQTSFYDF